MLTLGTVLGSMFLGGCAAAPECPQPAAPTIAADASDEPPPPSAPATVVIFVRHAEKASDGTADPPLTDRGLRRAECLATMLGPFAPDHLLTSQYQRTRATLEPLVEATGITPVVVEAGDAEAWATALTELPPGSRAVVSGHSNTLPTWVEALGGHVDDLDDEGNIPHDDYDRMIEVIVDGRGRTVASVTTAYCVEPGNEGNPEHAPNDG